MAKYRQTNEHITVNLYDYVRLKFYGKITRVVYRGLSGRYVKYDGYFYKVHRYGLPDPYISIVGE
jgi:hypothetical protein